MILHRYIFYFTLTNENRKFSVVTTLTQDSRVLKWRNAEGWVEVQKVSREVWWSGGVRSFVGKFYWVSSCRWSEKGGFCSFHAGRYTYEFNVFFPRLEITLSSLAEKTLSLFPPKMFILPGSWKFVIENDQQKTSSAHENLHILRYINNHLTIDTSKLKLTYAQSNKHSPIAVNKSHRTSAVFLIFNDL